MKNIIKKFENKKRKMNFPPDSPPTITINDFQMTIDQDVVISFRDESITFREIIKLRDKIRKLEEMMDEFHYIPEIGKHFFQAKQHFESRLLTYSEP